MKTKGSLCAYLITIAVLLALGSAFSTVDHFRIYNQTFYDDECFFMGLRVYWTQPCLLNQLKRMKNDVAHDKNKKTLIAITLTYVHDDQDIKLWELIRTLVKLHYNVIWIVVEAGGPTNKTAELLEESRQLLTVKHIGFDHSIPTNFPSEAREKMESRMRLQALRVVKEEKLDGVVMFADDTTYYRYPFFEEIQKVKWIGCVPVKIRAEHSYEVQGPACNSSLQIIGWHTLLCGGCNSTGDRTGIVLPGELKWSGFAMNSRLVWKEDEARPEWVKDLDMVLAANAEDAASPLSLVKDHSMVEPLPSCGKKWMVMISWHGKRYDSFYSGF